MNKASSAIIASIAVIKEEPPDEESVAAITVKEEPAEDRGEITAAIEFDDGTDRSPSTSMDCTRMPESWRVGKDNQADGKPELSLTEYCRQVVRENHPPGFKVQCALCGAMLKLWDRHGVQINVTLAHALCHVHVPLYQCRYCDFGSVTQGLIPGHLKSCHKIPNATIAHYKDSTNSRRREICDTIDRCFGNGMKHKMIKLDNKMPVLDAQDTVQPAEVKVLMAQTASSATSHVISAHSDSQILLPPPSKWPNVSVPFTQYCERVIKENYGPRDAVRCNVCRYCWSDRRTAIMRFVFHHVLNHMPISLFRCSLCPHKAKTKTAICDHLKLHYISSSHHWSYFTDSLNEHCSDVQEMIDRCFCKRLADAEKANCTSASKQRDSRAHNDGKGSPLIKPIGNGAITEGSTETIERIEGGVYVLKGDIRVRRFTSIKRRSVPGRYECSKCSFSTRYEKLMRKHINVRHYA